VLIGESFIGSGPNAAHLNTMVGSRSGPVGAAWATALATPSAGHAPFVVVLHPGVPVKPFTLFVNKAAIDGKGHARMTWGAAQAGVAAGVLEAVAQDGVADPDDELLIAAVWVDPKADDEDAVFANNRDATVGAILLGRAGLPTIEDVTAQRDDVWNPFYKPKS
jgi:5,6,7,8-tetrahydromethanopterin hydro-lyase